MIPLNLRRIMSFYISRSDRILLIGAICEGQFNWVMEETPPNDISLSSIDFGEYNLPTNRYYHMAQAISTTIIGPSKEGPIFDAVGCVLAKDTIDTEGLDEYKDKARTALLQTGLSERFVDEAMVSADSIDNTLCSSQVLTALRERIRTVPKTHKHILKPAKEEIQDTLDDATAVNFYGLYARKTSPYFENELALITKLKSNTK